MRRKINFELGDLVQLNDFWDNRIGIVIALLVLLSGSAVAQTHAPLPQQCVADANLWFHANKEALDKVPFTELGKRATEMWDCGASGAPDPRNSQNPLLDGYDAIWSFYVIKQGQRAQRFIERNGLSQQFQKEDEAGLR